MIKAHLKLRMALIEFVMGLVEIWFGNFRWGGDLCQDLGQELWNVQLQLDELQKEI